MKHSTVNRKAGALLTALLTLIALALPLMGTALANHGDRTLDVTPDQYGDIGDNEDGPFTGETVTFTANLSGPAGATAINIDAEHYAGPNDPDGANSPTSPDYTCDVPPGEISCTVSFTGTRATASNGTQDRIRFWIDHDKVNTTDESDKDEGIVASEDDCGETDPSGGTCPRAFSGSGAAPSATSPSGGPGPNENCEGADITEAFEPDCTDAVQVDYDNRSGVAQTLDCDDSGTPDTERETKQDDPTDPTQGESDVSSETYTCVVNNQFNSGENDVRVFGENENGINDPDTIDGASYNQPDYTCNDNDGQTTPDPNGIPGFEDDGVCYITVDQEEEELGTAEICFWVDLDNDLATDESGVCASEPTGENQLSSGSDSGNDLADQVELSWENASTFNLDCIPETDTDAVGTPHEVTCTATSSTSGNRAVSGVVIEVEITGEGDPDSSDSPQNPDSGCTTTSGGSCTFEHTSTTEGTTTYRAWINDGEAEPVLPDGFDEDVDTEEGQNESTTPGDKSEPDSTDVVTNEWVPAPTSLQMTPESDTAQVGECNPFTITATAGTGTSAEPAAGIVIDVEQRHATAGDDTASNEPTVTFCEPTSGPNPSDVDESRGDLGTSSDSSVTDDEEPDNKGTAGGETQKTTNSNGQITIGISITGGQGSDGSGTVEVTAFFDENDNDDPDAGEPADTSTKTWTSAAGTGGRVIDCEPETATTDTADSHTVTCTVLSATNQPQSGANVTFTEVGAGVIQSSSTVTTGADGKASVTVVSDEAGEQTITGTITNSTQSEPDTDECNRPANDPAGSPAGACSDSVTNTWTDESPSECSDDLDNDGDGDTDFPEDQGCDDLQDDDETNVGPAETCPGYEGDDRNQVIGTSGDDTLEGTDGDDVICGFGGNDTIAAGDGDDVVLGGKGNDLVSAGEGNDTVRGGGGNDTITGSLGADELRGGGGRDSIRGGGARDAIYGGRGPDILRGGKGPDLLDGGPGNDTCNGGLGRNRIKRCEHGRGN